MTVAGLEYVFAYTQFFKIGIRGSPAQIFPKRVSMGNSSLLLRSLDSALGHVECTPTMFGLPNLLVLLAQGEHGIAFGRQNSMPLPNLATRPA